jgi:glycosyltransferase involved in cell wall biosynthesis
MSLGLEDMYSPGTRKLLALQPQLPDIVHCHNLHGNYFDLRQLPALSRRVPVILTLHDTWMLAGHCAYSFDCERWKSGCGNCPDLSIYPAVTRDATAINWRRKQKIYAASRLYVATPSRWLMEKAGESMLMPGVVESRVIPYGIDLKIFHPGDAAASRSLLGIPHDAGVLLFAANGARKNIFKDYETIRSAVSLVAGKLRGERIVFLALGDSGTGEEREMIGDIEIRYVPYVKDARTMAHYYRAADLFLHAAKADNFPNAILEALACGTPVIGTAVGGIPEQIRGAHGIVNGPATLNAHGAEDATGALVPAGDSRSMADAVIALLADRGLRRQLSHNASRDASVRFDIERQVNDYLEWFREILQSWG